MSASEKARDGSPEMKNADVEGGSVFAETQDVFGNVDSGVDPVYQAKARILNDAFQQIGMGRYQACRHIIYRAAMRVLTSALSV